MESVDSLGGGRACSSQDKARERGFFEPARRFSGYLVLTDSEITAHLTSFTRLTRLERRRSHPLESHWRAACLPIFWLGAAGCEARAVDVTPELACRLTRRQGCPKLTALLEGDVEALPCADDSLGSLLPVVVAVFSPTPHRPGSVASSSSPPFHARIDPNRRNPDMKNIATNHRRSTATAG